MATAIPASGKQTRQGCQSAATNRRRTGEKNDVPAPASSPYDQLPLSEYGWRVVILDHLDKDRGESYEMTLWEAVQAACAFNREAEHSSDVFGLGLGDGAPTKAILIPPGVRMYGEDLAEGGGE